jgi:tripartite ATP-independent transporter DctM subunit
MEWYLILLTLFGMLMVVLLAGMPVAFGFLLVNIIGLIVFFDGFRGLALLAPSAATSVASFSLTPIPMFILMGELLTRSGLAGFALDAVDKWIGRLPGRLSVVCVTGGAVFGAMSGSSLASTALLGSTLGPEMAQRGYRPQMSVAPILGAAGLSPLIPPSALAVLLAVQARVSIGTLLIMGAAAGIVLAVLFNTYFVVRAILQPELAPRYDVPPVPLRERIYALRHVAVVGGLVFVVLGLILIGAATPSETAALGAVASAVAVIVYRRMSFGLIKEVVRASASTTGMILMIFVGSIAYSQMLAASGASAGFVGWVIDLPIDPLLTVVGLIATVFILGLFIDAISIMLITVPLYMPVMHALGMDPLWFALLVLIALEMGALTPPMGLQLFVLKGVQPDLEMSSIFRSVWPVVVMMWLLIILILLNPSIAYIFVP